MERQYRLKGERGFKIVYRRGTTVSSKNLLIINLKSKNNNLTKFGLSVGKKVGNAVKRNLIKRRLRSIITDLFPNIKKGYSYIIVAKSGITMVSYAELYREVEQLFGRVKY